MATRTFLVFPDGKEKALTLSYDDGVDTDIRMVGLMEKYGVKCTFNLNSGLFSKEDAVRAKDQIHFHLSKSQAKALYVHPLCEVATHTYSHPQLYGMPESVLMKEIVDDRVELENIFGGVVRGHAYPFGHCNDTIVDIWAKAGIAYARTVWSHHTFQLPDEWLKWNPTCHHNDVRFAELTEKFADEKVSDGEDGWLFYLWGHTYEFRANDNWNVIENFFEKVSDNDDVWYATNMEVYEYVNAWHSLVYSANGECVYNPTAKDVWVKVAGRIVAVPSGGMVELRKK